MRSDLTIGAAVQTVGYMTALGTDQPDLLTKTLGICAGAALGALVAAVLSDQPTSAQRKRRFVAAFGSGVFLSIVALWIWPSKAGIDPREFIFLVSGAAAFFGWRVVAKADSRADRIAEQLLDEIEERAEDALRTTSPRSRQPESTSGGYIPPPVLLPPPQAVTGSNREDGRVRIVPLVLLAGLALLAWVFRDVAWLVWAMFTTTVH